MERGTIMGSLVSLLTVAALLVSATADLVSGQDLGRPGDPQVWDHPKITSEKSSPLTGRLVLFSASTSTATTSTN